MSVPPADPPTKPEGSPALNLPAVEAPTGTFILQLFLIPLLIVTIVVLLWLLFGWVAHMGRDNVAGMVEGIERGTSASGQLAFELAGLLRNPDPKFDPVRRDAALAKRLADFLDRDLAVPLRQSDDKRLVMRRMYLCRVLGEFHVPAGLDVLLKAATEERDPIEVEVRFSALEAIAALADHCGPESFQQNQAVLDLLLASSETPDDTAPPPPPPRRDDEPTFYRPHAELRAVAAYGLGVIGGERATQRLRAMLHDSYPNARYNAATGLARQGDPDSARVLREMLDPDNPQAVRDERFPIDQARKRTTVLLNGIKATLLLAETNPAADINRLKESLASLTTGNLASVTIDRSRVKEAAREALRRLEATASPSRPRITAKVVE
jgi:HEAT repeat protein